MENVVIISIITSVTSLVIGIINYLNNRQNNKEIKFIELEKYKIEENKNRMKIREDYFKMNIQSIDKALRIIQSVIDKITIVIICNKKIEILARTVINDFSALREDLFNIYESDFTNYIDEEKDLIHDLKYKLLEIENLLIDNLKDKEFLEIVTDAIDTLQFSQNYLRERIHQIRDVKSTRISNYIFEKI